MMLKIKRVPTLLSNYQQDDDEEGSGCGRNCLGNCCIRGMKLPLYTFKVIDKMIHEKDVVEDEKRGSSVAFLDSLLLGEWEDRMQRGLFRYDVTACETKLSLRSESWRKKNKRRPLVPALKHPTLFLLTFDWGRLLEVGSVRNDLF
ncbi:hypothetical protein NE237_001847 [Protea cynaroides]|uniref:GDPGP1-like N-terminal domain-containing protein n=1 Tax=Protea cynaroides TaxID=273540 RepID=A0A9Q0KUR6_9MAGN|nr:hypothetical protein NE237_001847 [Protea cynaroides]